MTIPKIVFIVPYKNRQNQKLHFDIYMKYLMEDYNSSDYEIYFSNQIDNRNFNRGAIKNIGFMAIRKKYPNDYKNITFVFNDIDTLPYKKNFLNYQTTKNNLKHFYGFDYALGGIFSIKGADFEKINGFPNFWGWGFEDNVILSRVKYYKINIDRSNFTHHTNTNMNSNILHFDKTPEKLITNNAYKLKHNVDISTKDGINSLINIRFDIKNEYINIYSFDSIYIPYDITKFKNHNIITQGNKIKDPNRFAGQMPMQLGIK
jgi:hypothetical protein